MLISLKRLGNTNDIFGSVLSVGIGCNDVDVGKVIEAGLKGGAFAAVDGVRQYFLHERFDFPKVLKPRRRTVINDDDPIETELKRTNERGQFSPRLVCRNQYSEPLPEPFSIFFSSRSFCHLSRRCCSLM